MDTISNSNSTSTHHSVHHDHYVAFPVRMYSRNTILSALHIKSNRYLGIDPHRQMITFHPHKNPQGGDGKNELPWKDIVGIDTDTRGDLQGKYYLTIHAKTGDMKFKMLNAHDYYTLMEGLQVAMRDIHPDLLTPIIKEKLPHPHPPVHSAHTVSSDEDSAYLTEHTDDLDRNIHLHSHEDKIQASIGEHKDHKEHKEHKG